MLLSNIELVVARRNASVLPLRLFISIKFQKTGYLVHRFYKASFGPHQLFAEFLADTQTIGNGLVVNAPGWQELLEGNIQSFVDAWVTRSAFAFNSTA